jgi:multidrug efflux pump subunit AcrA (membrane-fusion protein)
VVEKLEVAEGDRVEAGQVLAVLQGIGLQRADVMRFRAELNNATRELERKTRLHSKGSLSSSAAGPISSCPRFARPLTARSSRSTRARANVSAPKASRSWATRRRCTPSPRSTRQTSVACASDSRRRCRRLVGRVERIGLKVGKKDVLSTDPVADADARVVEVEIRLEESEPAATLTNLRVDVVIEP